MRQIFKPIALLLFSYVRVFDEQGKLVGREQIVSGKSVLKLKDLKSEDIANLEIRVDKRGLRKLKGSKIILDAGDKVADISLSGVDTSKPLILTDLEQYFKASEEKIEFTHNHEMTFLFDEEWLSENQERFNKILLGQA